ncbi:MAG: SH3 domain-containing protein [Chloroflexaceae bacterium]|nr:SH3 domain-containing protein [Chloroflexaceae bacterium]
MEMAASSLATVFLKIGPILAIGLVIIQLEKCDYITSALPPSPSPFPTLARLPTVTPETPIPTPEPTATPGPPTPTPTPLSMEGLAVVAANVRSGPGIDYPILYTLSKDERVILHARHENWYQVTTPDGTEGWMAAEVLDVISAVATAVPTVTPTPAPAISP